MADSTLILRGYRELQAALKDADTRTRREVRTTLRLAGESVRQDAQQRFSSYGTTGRGGGTFGGSRASHADSAASYRVVVRARGIAVEQALRRTTGLHPEYGAVQMRRGLVPANVAQSPRVMHDLEVAMIRVAEAFNRGAPVG